MTSNTQTSLLMRWSITLVDFSILNLLVWLFSETHPTFSLWSREMKWVFLLVCNLSLLVSELRFSTVVHLRTVSVSDILRRIVGLVAAHALIAYVLLKAVDAYVPSGRVLLALLPPFLLLLLLVRFAERQAVKHLRRAGRNTRSVTFVGNDPELAVVYGKLPVMYTVRCMIRGCVPCRGGKGGFTPDLRESEACRAYLSDRTGAKFFVLGTRDCANTIYNSVPTWTADRPIEGCRAFFVFSDERAEDVARVIEAFKGGQAPEGKVRRVDRRTHTTTRQQQKGKHTK